MKDFAKNLFLVALKDVRDNLWMWAAIAAVLCGYPALAFGFIVFAFYDTLRAILEAVKDNSKWTVSEGATVQINLPEIKPVLNIVKTNNATGVSADKL